MTLSIVGLSGNITQPSKTRALVALALDQIAARLDAETSLIEIVGFGPDLAAARKPAELAPESREKLDRILAADALVVATPIYKGSYPGLFKHLIDLIDPQALIDRPVLIGATGGGEKHALAVEHQLRPLFGFFEARTLPTAVHVSDRDFAEGRITAEPALTRLSRAVAQFDALFPEHRRALRAAE